MAYVEVGEGVPRTGRQCFWYGNAFSVSTLTPSCCCTAIPPLVMPVFGVGGRRRRWCGGCVNVAPTATTVAWYVAVS